MNRLVSAVILVSSINASHSVFANEVITTAVKESRAQSQDMTNIIQTAKNSGVSLEEIEKYAINGGATTEEVALILNKQ